MKNTSLVLDLPAEGPPTSEQLAEAIRLCLCRDGLQSGDPVPAMKDYAIANRLRKGCFVKAFGLLAEQGLIRRRMQRRYEVGEMRC